MTGEIKDCNEKYKNIESTQSSEDNRLHFSYLLE